AARRSLALHRPRPPLGGSTKECRQTKNPPRRIRSEGLSRFFGASPVASASGIRSGATPCGRPQPNTAPPPAPSKPDISIWQGIGHFYLALTATDAVHAIRGDWDRTAPCGRRSFKCV